MYCQPHQSEQNEELQVKPSSYDPNWHIANSEAQKVGIQDKFLHI